MIELNILDPVECSITNGRFVLPAISYKKYFYRRQGHRKIRQEYPAYPILFKNKYEIRIPTGLVPRVVKYLKAKRIKYTLKDNQKITQHKPVYKYSTIELRDDQQVMIEQAMIKKRGVLQAPTGTGKTVMQMSVCASVDGPVLILAHTVDLVRQTVAELKKHGFKRVQQIGGGHQPSKLSGKIIVATIQSCGKHHAQSSEYFECVMVDEAHHVSKFDGQYAKLLSNLLAPYRFGFTATPSDDPEAMLCMESFIGPVIQKMTINEATHLVARPKIKVIRIPTNHKTKELYKYQDVYQEGVVKNKFLCEKIWDIISDHIDNDQTCLVFVNKIEHGKILSDGVYPFVHGGTSAEERLEVKRQLNSREIFCAIATVVWKEGINIPNLNSIILAGGGKSSIPVLQQIGRGLRLSKIKTEMTVYDFFDDSSHHLVAHFGNRMCLYMENEWM